MALLSKSNLENLPEWQFILSRLEDFTKSLVYDLRTAAEGGEIAAAAYAAGKLAMIDDLGGLAEELSLRKE